MASKRVFTAEQRMIRSARTLAHYHKLRRAAVLAYGNKCVCCGEMEYDFLQLDHVTDDGGKQRREIGDGPAFMRWLRDAGYPADLLQVLCANCHFAKTKGKVCPHKR